MDSHDWRGFHYMHTFCRPRGSLSQTCPHENSSKCCYHIKYFPETLIKIFSRFPRAWEIPAKKSELNWVSFSQQQIVKMKDFCLSRKRIFSSKGSILILNAWSKAALLNCLRCFQRQFRELCQKEALFMNNIYSQNRKKSSYKRTYQNANNFATP